MNAHEAVLSRLAQTSAPVPVSIKIEKLNPQLTVSYAGKVILNGAGDEQTAVRFTLSPAGDVLDVFTRQKLLIRAESKEEALK